MSKLETIFLGNVLKGNFFSAFLEGRPGEANDRFFKEYSSQALLKGHP